MKAVEPVHASGSLCSLLHVNWFHTRYWDLLKITHLKLPATGQSTAVTKSTAVTIRALNSHGTVCRMKPVKTILRTNAAHQARN